jgi:hypothetical protein
MVLTQLFFPGLFPIREGGLNFSAQPLSKFEASQFRKNPEIMKRIIKSYELMLDFYGIVLKDRTTGALARNPKVLSRTLAILTCFRLLRTATHI